MGNLTQRDDQNCNALDHGKTSCQGDGALENVIRSNSGMRVKASSVQSASGQGCNLSAQIASAVNLMRLSNIRTEHTRVPKREAKSGGKAANPIGSDTDLIRAIFRGVKSVLSLLCGTFGMEYFAGGCLDVDVDSVWGGVVDGDV